MEPTLAKALILGLAFAATWMFSIIEAFMFHMRDHKKEEPINIHYELNILRGIFAITACLVLFCWFHWKAYLHFVPLAMMFPFLHDGLLYTYRHLWDRSLFKRHFFHSPQRWEYSIPPLNGPRIIIRDKNIETRNYGQFMTPIDWRFANAAKIVLKLWHRAGLFILGMVFYWMI